MRIAAVGVLACVLVVAGCGSGGDGAAPATASSTGQSSSSSAATTSAADTFAIDGQLTISGKSGDNYGVDSTTSDPKTCYGTFGYADIKVGTQVQVTVDDKTVAVGSLTESVEDVTNDLCAFRVVVDDVPADLKFYKITIGGHNSEILSQEDAENVKLNLS